MKGTVTIQTEVILNYTGNSRYNEKVYKDNGGMSTQFFTKLKEGLGASFSHAISS